MLSEASTSPTRLCRAHQRLEAVPYHAFTPSTVAQQATQATQTRPLSSYGMTVPMREVTGRARSRSTHGRCKRFSRPARAQPVSVRSRSTFQRLIRRHTRQPLSSLHMQAHTRAHVSINIQHDMLRCMAKGWHAWHRYQKRAARAKRATSRAHCIISAHAPSRRHSPAKRRRAQFFSRSTAIFLRAVFASYADRHCDLVAAVRVANSGLRTVQCRGSARAFAASKLNFAGKVHIRQWAMFIYRSPV